MRFMLIIWYLEKALRSHLGNMIGCTSYSSFHRTKIYPMAGISVVDPESVQ